MIWVIRAILITGIIFQFIGMGFYVRHIYHVEDKDKEFDYHIGIHFLNQAWVLLLLTFGLGLSFWI